MKTTKSTTKLGRYFINRYNRAATTELKDCYKKPSAKKQAAFNMCKRMCKLEKGEGFKIISSGVHFFSVAWQTAKGLRVETAYSSYLITVNE